MLSDMAVSGTVPARPGRTLLDPLVGARWIRRFTMLVAIASGIWIFTAFGTEWVAAGMDTVPTVPPGSWCLVDRRASSARPGCDVFVEAPGGALLLSRVAEMDADTLTVLHPNTSSAWPDSRTFGRLPRRQLRGTVVTAFPPGEAVRGR
jgi:hypothetical protein